MVRGTLCAKGTWLNSNAPPSDDLPAMGHDASSANAYLRTKVLTAPPEQLRLMLLDGAIRFASQGREAMQRRDIEGMYSGVSQCRNIIFELLTTIGPQTEAELAQRVKALYTYMYTRLLEGSTERNPAKVEEVIGLLRYERDTWAMFIDRLTAERAGMAGPMSAGAGVQPKMAGLSMSA